MGPRSLLALYLKVRRCLQNELLERLPTAWQISGGCDRRQGKDVVLQSLRQRECFHDGIRYLVDRERTAVTEQPMTEPNLHRRHDPAGFRLSNSEFRAHRRIATECMQSDAATL